MLICININLSNTLDYSNTILHCVYLYLQSNIGKLADQRDVLVQRVSEADATNNLLRSRLDESEKLAMHTQGLHDDVSQRDGEIQGLNIRIQVRVIIDW